MRVRTAGMRISLTLLASAVLAACAMQPPRPLPAPAVITPLPAVAPPVGAVPVPKLPSKPVTQPWASIAASDVMHDCADAPLIRANAARYARSPAHFEQLLRQSLPLIIYVQKELRASGIPGEFAMLPMLESSYRASEPSHRGDAAGMWQFMPATARRHGITINRQYDGRLDPVASTQAAITMLKSLEQQFGDWRLVDMSYNAGPYAIMAALRDHPDLGSQAIPNIPVSAASRNHLAKLMALNCIVRDPVRFAVKLPQPAHDNELSTIKVPSGSRISNIADMAEISESTLRKLNPGYHSTRIPADSPRTLLLPADAAQTLLTALTVNASESVAQVDTNAPQTGAAGSIPLPAEPTAPDQGSTSGPTPASPTKYRVRGGETLWSIAHRFHVSVSDLKRWNHLQDNTVRSGEELRLHG
jgi:membrane-bound lytic murein transglycosylase D